ncbi:LamG-like jellyroll fold domain-containing protein [Neorhodopirellula lusitana]|uniref:LamG-like jellyroll fold domain-containing protein n=1 Tax=Neorhodopirellula lusitana TaxID=445327 RepID=UPI00384F061E
MNAGPLNARERSQLMDDLITGEISEADLLRIEAELSIDAQARQEYYRKLQLDQLLEQEARDRGACVLNSEAARDFDSLRPAPDPINVHRSPALSLANRWWVPLLVGMAASWLLFQFLAVPHGKRSPFVATSIQGDALTTVVNEQSASGFGSLTGLSNVVWDSAPIPAGSLLTNRDIRLLSGMVRLELFSGVDIVIEGKADFTIDSPMQLTLRSGKARARVPEPAHGFRIKTSSGDIVDLGTEFSVDANLDHSRIQVVEGEIELHGGKSLRKRVRPGTTISWASDGLLTEVADDATKIPSVASIGPTEFQQITQRRHALKIQRWQQYTANLRRDQRLVALYQVNPGDKQTRRLPNQVKSINPRASVGAVVASQRAPDRWGREGGALSFRPMGSRVRVNVPGEFKNLSLFCWVKIDKLDRRYNSLFLTDGHEEHEPHWQIMNDGRMFFSIKPSRKTTELAKPSRKKIFFSPPIESSELNDRWTMLATTYNTDQRRVTHYVNGDVISSQSIQDKDVVETIRIGAASIGNWSEPMYQTDPEFVIRNLNGALDELAIFNGVLSTQEIQEVFQTGNPHE